MLNIHFVHAVRAVQDAGVQIYFLRLTRPDPGSGTLLGCLKGFLVDQRFVSMLEKQLFLGSVVDYFL